MLLNSNTLMQLIFTFLATLAFGLIAVKLLQYSNLANVVIDTPNHRSLHEKPIPKIGGIGIALAVTSGTVFASWFYGSHFTQFRFLLIAYACLLLLSIIDDAKNLTVKTRLSFHFIFVATWLFSSCYSSELYCLKEFSTNSFTIVLALIIVTLGIVWATNLFNFMDGSDGLAGVMALFGFSAYALAAFNSGDLALALICVSVTGALLSFLVFNWPPAKIFLGDSGSIPIGFLSAAVGAIGLFKGYWAADFPLMIFAMFWVDATFALARRALNAQKIGEPHRDHWYQKAIRSGNSHRNVLLIHVVCNSAIFGLAFYSMQYSIGEHTLIHTLIMLLVLIIAIGFGLWAEREFKNSQSTQNCN
jgi:UDP-GlcNAc:undecaprenyl-phosphate/decaprenyl-phosphate GlcNAc-1-phosphate transferase